MTCTAVYVSELFSFYFLYLLFYLFVFSSSPFSRSDFLVNPFREKKIETFFIQTISVWDARGRGSVCVCVCVWNTAMCVLSFPLQTRRFIDMFVWILEKFIGYLTEWNKCWNWCTKRELHKFWWRKERASERVGGGIRMRKILKYLNKLPAPSSIVSSFAFRIPHSVAVVVVTFLSRFQCLLTSA